MLLKQINIVSDQGHEVYITSSGHFLLNSSEFDTMEEFGAEVNNMCDMQREAFAIMWELDEAEIAVEPEVING